MESGRAGRWISCRSHRKIASNFLPEDQNNARNNDNIPFEFRLMAIPRRFKRCQSNGLDIRIERFFRNRMIQKSSLIIDLLGTRYGNLQELLLRWQFVSAVPLRLKLLVPILRGAGPFQICSYAHCISQAPKSWEEKRPVKRHVRHCMSRVVRHHQKLLHGTARGSTKQCCILILPESIFLFVEEA